MVQLTCSECKCATDISDKSYYNSVINVCPACGGSLYSDALKYALVDSPDLARHSWDLKALFELPDVEFIRRAIVKLVVVSSSSRMHTRNYGNPPRSYFDKPEIFHWRQWDFGRALVSELAKRCRHLDIKPDENLLWDLVDPFFQNEYKELHEVGREVSVNQEDFESLCVAIRARNNIRIQNHLLTSHDLEEATGHYGECTAYRRWVLTLDNIECAVFVVDEHELAEAVYEKFNGIRPNQSSYGDVARESYRYCVDYE